MTHYCLGFLFTADRHSIVLIKKQKPTWQAGKWNGIGGHIEAGESASDAMRRECWEETGVDVDNFERFGTLMGADYTVALFRAFSFDAASVKQMEAEAVALHDAVDLPRTIPNLRWLVPMALDDVVDATIDYDPAGVE